MSYKVQEVRQSSKAPVEIALVVSGDGQPMVNEGEQTSEVFRSSSSCTLVSDELKQQKFITSTKKEPYSKKWKIFKNK